MHENVWCWVSAAYLLWHLLLSSWSLSHCLILYIVSKPFIKHCWKFCFLTSTSPLIYWTETELSLTTMHFLEWKAPHLAFYDFSEHEMAVFILFASRQEPCRDRQRGQPAPSLDPPEARGRNFLILYQLIVKKSTHPALFWLHLERKKNFGVFFLLVTINFLVPWVLYWVDFQRLGAFLESQRSNKKGFRNSASVLLMVEWLFLKAKGTLAPS